MRSIQAAVFEPNPATRKRLAEGLTRAGLKVTPAVSPAALGSERILLLGPSTTKPGSLARTARERLPDVLVLQAQAGHAQARHADGVVPMPLSSNDLKARLPELLKRRSASDPAGTAAGGVDPFTGFYPFPLFKEILYVEVKRARRYGFPLALALLELDPLPRAAQKARRQLVQGLALAIRRSLRDIDMPVQLTPDRVLLVMPHTELAGALIVCQRIVSRVGKGPLSQEAWPFRPTLSAGVAAEATPGRELSVADLVQNAQGALERARASGGSRVEFYDRADVEIPPSPEDEDPAPTVATQH